MNALLPIRPDSYVPSALHGADRIWSETNCYADMWIELLHALDLDPRPALAFTVSVDFEGDQWQFLKFPAGDLWDLYRLDVAEMTPWRGLEEHVENQLSMGRLLTVEVDAYYLPDTAGTSYATEHVKSSIVPNLLDRDGLRLGYFHGPGYFELADDDYRGIFGRWSEPGSLPPYVELIKLDRLERLNGAELLRRTARLFEAHLDRRPSTNPVTRFRKRFDQDVDWLRLQNTATFHLYAFATLRQFGACCELTASFLDFLADSGLARTESGQHFTQLAMTARAAQFSLARLSRGRVVDVSPLFEEMEDRWDGAMASISG